MLIPLSPLLSLRYRLPGVTAPHRSPSAVRAAELREATGYASSLGIFPRSYEAGANPIPYSHFAESPEAFVGGVSTGEEDGLLGVWGFRMEDPLNNQSDVHAFLRETLQAYKTVFFFGEARVAGTKSPAFMLALGTNITSREMDAGPIQTTLFQQHLGADPKQHPIAVNAELIDSLPYASEPHLSEMPVVKLQDAAKNGFVVVKRPGTNITVARATQTMPRSSSWSATDTRNFTWASLVHEVTDFSAPSYEYAVLLSTEDNVLEAFSPASRYKVLADAKPLHAVECLTTRQVALVFYSAGDTSISVSNQTHLRSSSAPCALVIKPSHGATGDPAQLDVSFANPALGFLREGQRFNSWSTVQKKYVHQRTQPQNTSLNFSGHWELEGEVSQVPSHASQTSSQALNVSTTFDLRRNVTSLHIRTIDGISIAFVLVSNKQGVSQGGPAAALAKKPYSLSQTRDFSDMSCAETRTWVQLRDLLVQGTALTGGT